MGGWLWWCAFGIWSWREEDTANIWGTGWEARRWGMSLISCMNLFELNSALAWWRTGLLFTRRFVPLCHWFLPRCRSCPSLLKHWLPLALTPKCCSGYAVFISSWLLLGSSSKWWGLLNVLTRFLSTGFLKHDWHQMVQYRFSSQKKKARRNLKITSVRCHGQQCPLDHRVSLSFTPGSARLTCRCKNASDAPKTGHDMSSFVFAGLFLLWWIPRGRF